MGQREERALHRRRQLEDIHQLDREAAGSVTRDLLDDREGLGGHPARGPVKLPDAADASERDRLEDAVGAHDVVGEVRPARRGGHAAVRGQIGRSPRSRSRGGTPARPRARPTRENARASERTPQHPEEGSIGRREVTGVDALHRERDHPLLGGGHRLRGARGEHPLRGDDQNDREQRGPHRGGESAPAATGRVPAQEELVPDTPLQLTRSLVSLELPVMSAPSPAQARSPAPDETIEHGRVLAASASIRAPRPRRGRRAPRGEEDRRTSALLLAPGVEAGHHEAIRRPGPREPSATTAPGCGRAPERGPRARRPRRPQGSAPRPRGRATPPGAGTAPVRVRDSRRKTWQAGGGVTVRARGCAR